MARKSSRTEELLNEMNPSKTVRPAIAQTMNGPRESDQLGSRISPPNTLSAATSQAPCPADDRGEDDIAFFRARPALTRRLRFPFADEFPLDMTEQDDLGVAIVSVRMDRDEFGQPSKRVRA